MTEHGEEEKTKQQDRGPFSVIQFTEEEKEVLAFLAKTRRVDKRWLSDEQKLRIRNVVDQLHNKKNLSLLRISKEVGRSYTAIWGLCRALEIHTRSVAEADRNSIAIRSKHKRTSFDGTEEERAYILGFRHGDLTALQVSGTAVMVTSTTTHPAFAKLFHELFQRYGHIYQYPMYEEGKGYKWKVAVRLDNSFQFLLQPRQEALRSYAQDRKLFLAWLAGLVDSDGNIHTTEGEGRGRARVVVYNNDTALLQNIISHTRAVGYHFDGPYLMKPTGSITPYGIRYTKDLWYISLQRIEEVQRILLELTLKHTEKMERKTLALLVGHTEWKEIGPKLLELKNSIKEDVIRFRRDAEENYLQKLQRKAVNESQKPPLNFFGDEG